MEVEERLHVNWMFLLSVLWESIATRLPVCSSIHQLLGTQVSLGATKINLQNLCEFFKLSSAYDQISRNEPTPFPQSFVQKFSLIKY